ncbi:Fe2+-dependent dioxygenase [Falsiroseomonas selenitidurans]|uniref:Fe2+-dependent dioxygenase n=1 Tax=Falsiroseomonas selenitidurans TaxID=2716335 RepID=A0ABX1E9F4_9PROT|nr:Fe2+-dependent dioxygenase [Falsiroseomonas selenitidurans]NKC31555.1 Fe2+-dependent dioxygenase [Falsiroseomonas selenitidurans]
MLVRIPEVLNREEILHCRRLLEASQWVDGRATAGEQSAKVKRNLQVPEGSPVARELGEVVLRALGRSPIFTSAALPLRVYPPMFNRYEEGMHFHAHVDNAIRHVPGTGGMRLRADVSSTLFLSDPAEYEGGELVIQDTYGAHAVKLPAGDLVVYPATSLHNVTPITRGSRWGCFFWSQSMVKDDGKRAHLHDMDMAIMGLRQALPDDHPAVVTLTASYHNLLRRWAEM